MKDNRQSQRTQPLNQPREAASSGPVRMSSQTREAHQINAQDLGSNIRPASSPSIEIHIRELVLHGFAHADRRPIAEMIERELSALLAHKTFSVERSFKVAHLDGGAFQLESSKRHESAGTNIARAIYGGLRQ
jgi:hypothetical protein